MVGITGFVSQMDSEYLKKNLKKMGELLFSQSPDRSYIYIKKGIGINYVYFKDPGEFLSEDQELLLLVFGKIYNDLELREKLFNKGDNDAYHYSIGKLLLRTLREFGVGSLSGLNGIYLIFIWQTIPQKLIIINDRYGFRKLYYWHSGRNFIFATEAKSISWLPEFPKVIDEMALSDFLSFGFPLEDRTFFKNMKMMPPCNILTFQDGILSFEKYWDYSFYQESSALWLEKHYIDGLFEIIKNSIKRRISDTKQIAIPLSGGLDSRTIVGMLHKIKYSGDVLTYSYGQSNSLDVLYGRRIAKGLNYSHAIVPIKSDSLSQYAKHFVWLTDGMVCCHNAMNMGVNKPFLLNRNLNRVMTGFLGDPLTGGIDFYKRIIGLEKDEEIIRALYQTYAVILHDKDLSIYLNKEIYDRVKMQSYETLRSIYYRADTDNPYFRSVYINLCQRQRKYIFPVMYCLEEFANVESPFTDNAFVDFNLHVPPSLHIDRNLIKKMLTLHLPKVAKIPYTATQRPLKPSFMSEWLPLWRWDKFLEYDLPAITGRRLGRNVTQGYTKSEEAIRKGSKDFIINHLKNSEFLANFLNIQKVNELLDNHLEGKISEPVKICAFLTIDLWGELFF